MKFRHFIICLTLLIINVKSYSNNGYTIGVTIKDKNLFSTNLILCYYYGSSNNIQIVDTGKIDNFGKVKFKNDKRIIGGIYILYTFDTKKNIEFLLSNGDNFQLEISFEKYPFEAKVLNSIENSKFIEYQKMIHWYSNSNIKTSKNGKDSLFVYRRNYVSKNPTDLLSKVFNLMLTPEVNPNPKNHRDSLENYENYKFHFWDFADLNDERIIYTPILENKLSTYISLIDPSNFNNDIDNLLSKPNNSNYCFAYLIVKLIKETEINSYLYLGYYEKYCYLIDKYIIGTTNKFISSDLKERLIDKSNKLKKMETSAFITNVICTKQDVDIALAANKTGISLEEQIEERKRLETIRKKIENGTFSGEHYFDYDGYKYTGHFENGKPNGSGKWTKSDGSWYEGQFKDGIENGNGTLRQTDGFRYTGNFTDGVPNGQIKVEKWTLMGLAKNAWTATYRMGELVNSEQTEDGMDRLFSNKGSSSSSSNSSNNSSSNSSSDNKSNTELVIPTVKKCEFESTKSSFVMGESDKYYVTFKDGTSGYLFYSKKYSLWYISNGTQDFSYDSKENAYAALYEYKEKSTIRKQGRKD